LKSCDVIVGKGDGRLRYYDVIWAEGDGILIYGDVIVPKLMRC